MSGKDDVRVLEAFDHQRDPCDEEPFPDVARYALVPTIADR